MQNIIEAKDIFSAKVKSKSNNLEDIKSFINLGGMDEDYDVSIGITNELLDEFVYIMTEEYGFDLSNKTLVDDLSFLGIILQAIMDRYYGIENALIQNIDEAIEELKSRQEVEEIS